MLGSSRCNERAVVTAHPPGCWQGPSSALTLPPGAGPAPTTQKVTDKPTGRGLALRVPRTEKDKDRASSRGVREPVLPVPGFPNRFPSEEAKRRGVSISHHMHSACICWPYLYDNFTVTAGRVDSQPPLPPPPPPSPLLECRKKDTSREGKGDQGSGLHSLVRRSAFLSPEVKRERFPSDWAQSRYTKVNKVSSLFVYRSFLSSWESRSPVWQAGLSAERRVRLA